MVKPPCVFLEIFIRAAGEGEPGRCTYMVEPPMASML